MKLAEIQPTPVPPKPPKKPVFTRRAKRLFKRLVASGVLGIALGLLCELVTNPQLQALCKAVALIAGGA